RIGALVDQGLPGHRHCRWLAGGVDDIEVQVRERDVQRGYEHRIGEELPAQLRFNEPGHIKVHSVEAGQPVILGKTGGDHLHTGYCPRYGGDWRDPSQRLGHADNPSPCPGSSQLVVAATSMGVMSCLFLMGVTSRCEF